MTDQTVPDVTDDDRKLAREWAEFIESDVTGLSSRRKRAAARVILDAVPAPPRPTLADMNEEERAACQWMQADVKDYEITAGIIAKINPTDAHLIASDGETWFLELDTITPRPDLPRLEWPGDTPTAPNDVAVGTVIESADDPRIDALPVGSILLDRDEETVAKRHEVWNGPGYTPIPEEGDEFGPWTVMRIGWEDDQ